MTSWSVQDAKNRFSEVMTAARKAPQTVTKHGKAAVVIVDADEYERQQKQLNGKAPDLVDLLLSMPTKKGFEFDRRKPKHRDIDF